MTDACPYYVYIYFRPNGIPCYVGKGRGRRCAHHIYHSHNKHLAAIIAKAGGTLPVVFVRERLTNDAAMATEVALIAAIGREANGGPLVNLTDGGDGSSGSSRKGTISEEGRERLREAHTGKTVSEETRKRQSERALLNGSRPPSRKGLPSPNLGKPVSREQKEKLRASLLAFNARKKSFHPTNTPA